jgi:hypothetical protein
MHHYGEDLVFAEVSDEGFTIRIQSHDSDATINVSGPIQGVFEDPEKVVDKNAAFQIGRALAHQLRDVTGEATANA